MAREFRAGDVSALTGLSTNLVLKWAQAGLLEPRKGKPRGNPRGQGRAVYFTERDVFVASMVRALTKRGLTLSYVRPVARLLNTMTLEEIERAAGECQVLVAAGSAMKPRIVDLDSAALGDAAAQAGKSGTNEMFLTIPLAIAWDRFQAGLKHYDQHLAAPLN